MIFFVVPVDFRPRFILYRAHHVTRGPLADWGILSNCFLFRSTKTLTCFATSTSERGNAISVSALYVFQFTELFYEYGRSEQVQLIRLDRRVVTYARSVYCRRLM